jgi:SAM-dependent methyltransferase
MTRNSVFKQESELSECSLLPEPLLKAVWSEFSPRSVLDVGCGTGRSLDFFVSQGAETHGVEGSRLAATKARHPECIKIWNLNKELNLGRRFDLVWCFEVAEHIHSTFTSNLLRTLTNHSDRIVMSAAHPGQGGESHFNEQPRPYWIEQFAALGYRHDDDARARITRDWTWYPENVFVFRKP